MISMGDCSVEAVFGPHPEQLMIGEPYGYAINRGGPGPGSLDTKSPFWGLADDPLKIPGCTMVLVRFLDGSPVALRYRDYDIVGRLYDQTTSRIQ